jgi:outer membrane protein insertion porin family
VASCLAALVVSLALAAPIAAEESPDAVSATPIVKDISLHGLKRIDPSAVRLKMTQLIGEPLSAEKVSGDIKALFAMGYFEDIAVEAEPFEGGIALRYRIREKPVLWDVEFQGNKEVEEEKLREGIGLKAGSIADTVLIQDNAAALRVYYESKGFPFATIIPIVRTIREGQVVLTYLVEEGRKVRVRRVGIEGNEKIADRAVRKAMATSRWHIYHYITDGGFYERETLTQDLARIKSLYYDQGYLEADVSEPRIEYSDDREWLDIALTVHEGAQYTVSTVGYEGNKVIDRETLAAKVDLLPEGVFNKGAVGRGAAAITDAYGERGYAMANVYPDLKVDETAKTAGVTFRVHEGEQFDVGRIAISGNTKTRDKVIRREVRLDEGARYNSALLRRSYDRIVNLKYFDNVNLTPVPRVEQREIDINVDVEERATGSLTMGLGYSTVDKLVATAEYTQGNVGGTGRIIKIKGETGSDASTYDITFIEPWLMDREVALSARAYRETDEYTSYDKEATGGVVSLGKSLGEYWRVSAAYRLEEADISNISEDASVIILDQEGVSLTSSITPSLGYDSRDNVLSPHRGQHHRFSFTLAGLGGDNKFYQADVDLGVHIPVTKRTTFSVRGRYGHAEGIWGEELPLYERYYVGGITTMRGYREIGPETEDGEYIGGENRLIFNLEYSFPLLPEMRLGGVTFLDAGNAFDDWDGLVLKYSTGLGIRWLSPIGPIRLEWAYLLNPKEDDPTGRWEFTIGTFF